MRPVMVPPAKGVWIGISCLFVFLISCTKNFEFTPDPLADKIVLLTGNYGRFQSWGIVSMSIDRINIPLDAAQKDFFKQYNMNGSFMDGDGMRGKWVLRKADTLREVITNSPGGAYYTQDYSVQDLSRSRLILSYKYNGRTVQLSFCPKP